MLPTDAASPAPRSPGIDGASLGAYAGFQGERNQRRSPVQMGRTALKIVLGIIGALGAVYAVVGVVQLIGVISTSDASNPYSTSQIAASIVPVCLGLIVCVACFRYVLKKDD